MRHIFSVLGCFLSLSCVAETFPLPPFDTDLIGSVYSVSARHQDTLLDIAKQFNIGQTEISISNPGIDRWIPGENTKVLLPTRYVLPKSIRKGIILNVPEMRLYFYPQGKQGLRRTVETFPVSIGRMDWQTPLGDARIIEKKQNPVWRPPESIKKEHADAGDPLPDVVPSGPDNPLGNFAMRLNLPGYLIHSTNKPLGIGMRVTHGCVRMYPTDIEKLFPKVRVGTHVQILNQPVKAGWLAESLYLEVHPPLEEDVEDAGWLQHQADLLIAEMTETIPVLLNRQLIKSTIKEQTGVPVIIGQQIENGNVKERELEE